MTVRKKSPNEGEQDAIDARLDQRHSCSMTRNSKRWRVCWQILPTLCSAARPDEAQTALGIAEAVTAAERETPSLAKGEPQK